MLGATTTSTKAHPINHMCQTDPVKGHVAAGFHSNQARTHLIWISQPISQPSKNTPVFLLGWNENLQPHGPLLDQFDTTAINYEL